MRILNLLQYQKPALTAHMTALKLSSGTLCIGGQGRVGRRGGRCLSVKSELMLTMRDDIVNGASDQVESLWLEL